MQSQKYDALIEKSADASPKLPRRTLAVVGLVACSALALAVACRPTNWPAPFGAAAHGPTPFNSISLVSLKGDDIGLTDQDLMAVTDQHPLWEHMPEKEHELVRSKMVSFFVDNTTDTRLYAKVDHPDFPKPTMLYVCCKGVVGTVGNWYSHTAPAAAGGAVAGSAGGPIGAGLGAIGAGIAAGAQAVANHDSHAIWYVFGGCKSTC